MKQTIYIPVKADEELPPRANGTLTRYSEWVPVSWKDDEIRFVYSRRYDFKHSKWEEEGGIEEPIYSWLKPVEMPSEEEIDQAIELLLASHLTLIDENGRDGSWPAKHIANRSFNEKKQAITKLMKGEK